MPTLRFGNRRIPMPASRLVRMTLGVLLVIFGLVGFLPVLGFWMLPLGLIVLSMDLPVVRRWRRRFEVSWGRWRNGNKRNGANGNNRGGGPGAGAAGETNSN